MDSLTTITDTAAPFTDQATPHPSDLPLPCRLSHYELLAPLGRGGMSTVYDARDLRLGRRVAVKVLAAERQIQEASRRRFEREARLTSALAHPGIITLFDIGQDRGRDFIVMERVDGVPLSERLRDGPLEVPEALALALALADAMGAAHDTGIIHRDLKPSNIMVTGSGRIKILDFGIAKLTHDFDETYSASAMATPLTEVGTPVGTLGYMAPEQIAGETVDARADLFALGVVLYRMLTGRAPFGGCHPAVLAHQILHRDPAPLDLEPATLSGRLDTVVARTLAKQPDDRYTGVGELSQALAELAAESDLELPSPATSSGSVTVPPGGWPKPSRAPSWRSIFGAAALGLTLGIALFASASWRAPAERAAPSAALATQPSVSKGDASAQLQWVVDLAQDGDCEGAEREREALRATETDLGAADHLQLAAAYELCGEREDALRALEDALGKGVSIRTIEARAELAELRTDPRYQDLVTGSRS